MTKILFSDLDETLLVNHHVPEINRKAISKMVEKGHKFVPCTGRAFFMIDDILDETGLTNKENEYSICFNGGMILENKDAKVLYYKGLSYDKTVAIFEKGMSVNLSIMVFTENECHIFMPEETELKRKTSQHVSVILHDDYNVSILKNRRIAKVLIINPEGLEALQALYDTFDDSFKNNYEITFSSNRYMEFNEIGVSKGDAVRFLADYLNIPIENTIAIGDNYNDEEMIKAAHIGCVVKSGVEDVKKIAQYVCEKDYMDGSVAEVIERFVLK